MHSVSQWTLLLACRWLHVLYLYYRWCFSVSNKLHQELIRCGGSCYPAAQQYWCSAFKWAAAGCNSPSLISSCSHIFSRLWLKIEQMASDETSLTRQVSLAYVIIVDTNQFSIIRPWRWCCINTILNIAKNMTALTGFPPVNKAKCSLECTTKLEIPPLWLHHSFPL